MNDIVLSGLDGSNPLAFLAALGVLRALSEQHTGISLSWRDEGVWRPVLHGFEDVDALARILDLDRQSFSDDQSLALSYGDGERDLKPPPEEFRRFLQALVEHSAHGTRRSVDLAGAFATDVARDNNGKTKPTALHFTAGQQKFLVMARELQQSVTEQDIVEALFGPWRYESPLAVLGWDATTNRDYALRAGNPSGEKKLGVPGADWLALRGLAFMTVAPRGRRIVTTGCSGEWKTGRFRWPLWNAPLNADVVASVLRTRSSSSAERRRRGIPILFECAIKRSDQGGYGSFSPPRPVVDENTAISH